MVGYKSLESVLSIKLNERKSPSEFICEAQIKVEYFLTRIGTLSVPLKRNGEVVGSIRFKTFEDTLLKQKSQVDPRYPHVRNNCMVCKDTH